MQEQLNNPLHGKRLDTIIEHLVDYYGGWESLGRQINIKCFNENPSMKSSLTFLRKTPWARQKVEELYLRVIHKK
ncbi:VF530 family protein [Sphingobacterium lumbrici]|uniref:VF530 family protein n=1 Tax=Sphingobacterium lumbrici TaxID=2559600 RepID=UPI00112DF3D2|nr:VF530 family protein [Sphingobacterium lumbrici]